MISFSKENNSRQNSTQRNQNWSWKKCKEKNKLNFKDTKMTIKHKMHQLRKIKQFLKWNRTFKSSLLKNRSKLIRPMMTEHCRNIRLIHWLESTRGKTLEELLLINTLVQKKKQWLQFCLPLDLDLLKVKHNDESLTQ